MSSVLGGSDAVFVAAGMISLNYVLMGKPGVKAIEQLKGGTLAISRFGSATDTIARFALKKIGLAVGKDVTLIQVGSGPERLSALQTGRVTAAVINPPSSFIAEKRGLAVLADVAQMGLMFQHTGAATTKRYIREHNDIVRRYVRAHVEAVHRMWTDKTATVRALGKYMGSGLDREILEKSYDNVMHETLYPKLQYPSQEGLKTVIEDLAERDPRAKTVKPEQFVDMSFIRELDQSGFIDGLYKKNRASATFRKCSVHCAAMPHRRKFKFGQPKSSSRSMPRSMSRCCSRKIPTPTLSGWKRRAGADLSFVRQPGPRRRSRNRMRTHPVAKN